MNHRVALSIAVFLVSAESGYAGSLFRGRCHMGYCDWFRVEKRINVQTNDSGSLVEAVMRLWSLRDERGSVRARRVPQGSGSLSTIYALCSKTRPTIIYRDDAGQPWTALPLAPDRAEDISGATEGAHIQYFAVCHGLAVQDMWKDGVKSAKTLGYHTDPSRQETVELARPEDVMMP